LNQAWNIINSQSSIFNAWLPRVAKIVGKLNQLQFIKQVINFCSF
jgi:hypothetical protein